MADAGSVDRLSRSCCGVFVSMSDVVVPLIETGSGAPEGIDIESGNLRRSNVILPPRCFRAWEVSKESVAIESQGVHRVLEGGGDR